MYSVSDFVNIDNPRALFPLRSTSRYINIGSAKLQDFVYKFALDKSNPTVSFASSPIVFALKDKMHLRRLLLLDAAATFYIYDFVLRNWKAFELQNTGTRQFYGYAFDAGKPIDPFKQYHDFRREKYLLKSEYKYFLKVDITNCFNSFYHHEITSYLSSSLPSIEGQQFGQFLREINSGTSINCFPQGIYPSKALGNSYLSFAEKSEELRSPAIIRFLDDFYLFANKLSVLERDLVILQQLLGSRGLFLNEGKTQFGSKDSDFDERNLDSIKISLLKKREKIRAYDDEMSDFVEDYYETDYNVDGDEEEEEEENEYIVDGTDERKVTLEPEEVEYLKSIIQSKEVAEEDVELALSLLKQDQEEAIILIDLVLTRYPHLIKDLYRHISDIEDYSNLWPAIKKRVKEPFLTEFELFWLVRIVLDVYPFSKDSAHLLLDIFSHQSATPIVQAAILEFPDNRFGFEDLKINQLRAGSGGFITACAIAGIEKLEKAKRNQIYKYASKISPYHHVLCEIMSNA